jgi:hypothetical protein
MRILVLGLVFIVMSSQGCKSAQNNGSTDAGGTGVSSGTGTEAQAPQQAVAKNRLGIPLSLPYAGDLDAYNTIVCKLGKMDDMNPDMELFRQRGEMINKLMEWEKKLNGKELEEYQKWAAVASDASWCH